MISWVFLACQFSDWSSSWSVKESLSLTVSSNIWCRMTNGSRSCWHMDAKTYEWGRTSRCKNWTIKYTVNIILKHYNLQYFLNTLYVCVQQKSCQHNSNFKLHQGAFVAKKKLWWQQDYCIPSVDWLAVFEERGTFLSRLLPTDGALWIVPDKLVQKRTVMLIRKTPRID